MSVRSITSTNSRPTPGAYAVVVVVSLILTGPSLFYDFVQDDHLLVVDNPTITSWRHLGHILTSDYFARVGHEDRVGYYRPFTNLSYLVDHSIWGLSPTGFHLTNVILGVLTAALFLRVASLFLPAPYAMVAGVLFAVHPGRVQAVGVISARSDLFAALCCLLAVLQWLGGRGGRRHWIAGGFLLLGLIAKEASIAVVAILGAWSLARIKGSPDWRRLATWSALVLPVGVYVAVRTVLKIAPLPFQEYSLSATLAMAGRVFGYYLLTLLLPLNTAAGPLLPAPSPTWGALLLAFIPFLAPLAVAKSRPAVAMGASWAVVSLSVLLVPQAIRNPTLEGYLAPSSRFLYLPAVGAALLWAGVLHWIGQRPGLHRIAMGAGIVWAGLLAAEFLPRLAAYANDVSIDRAAVREFERVPEGQRTPQFQAALLLSQSMVLREDEQLPEAAGALERACRLDPRSLRMRVLLASLWHDTGRDSLAIALLRDVLDPSRIQRWPHSELSIHYMTGTVLLSDILVSAGAHDEALAWLHALVRRYPASWKARSKLAIVQLDAGDVSGAVASFQRALALVPRGRWETEIRERLMAIMPAAPSAPGE